MDIINLLFTLCLSVLPISELRGAIPFAVARGMPLYEAAIISVLGNIMVAPLAYIFLESLHKLLYKWPFYRGFFDRFVEKARRKVHDKVKRYGYLGLALFVAVPLPVTGAWTGVLGGWILGMDKKKVMLSVAAGVITAGIIVSLVVALGLEALSIFIKHF